MDRGHRWVGLIAGLVSIVLGVLLLISPRRSLIVLAWQAGLAIIVWGVRQIIAAFREQEVFDRAGGLVVGLLSVGFGAAVFVIPDVSLRLLRVLLGIAAIVWSLLDSGRPFLSTRSRWWGFLVRGLGGLGLGLALIFVPEPTVALIGVLLGILLLLWGVVEVAATVVGWRQHVPAPSA